MKILATDLDRTLLPNGHWPADPDAIDLFNELTASGGVLVVYVTGRNLNLTEQAINEYHVRQPDVLIGATDAQRRDLVGSASDKGLFIKIDLPFFGFVEASNTIEKRSFTSAVGANDAGNHPLFQFKIYVVNSD